MSKNIEKVQNVQKIKDLIGALKLTDELPLTTVANGIVTITKDGKTLQLGHLEDDISSREIYDELVAIGVLKRTEHIITKTEYRYTLAESKHKNYFISNGTTVYLKTKFEEYARLVLLNSIFKRIREKRNERKNIQLNQAS